MYNYTKIESIYNFYLKNGFHHSLQEVADAVRISKKTLFNRYISKENLECCLIDYWQQKSNERILQRMEFANNAVEKLLMFLFELQYCKSKESIFFQKNKELFLEKVVQKMPHFVQLDTIFRWGITEDFFQFETDPKVFAYFFLFNSLFLLLSDSLIYTEYIDFLFAPILTEKGKTVFKEIDIEQVFTLK